MNYSELNALSAESFLDPDLFVSEYDHMDRGGYAEEQYRKGLEISNSSESVGISANGTWWARGKDGSLTTSYEGIGYHLHTSALLRGLLAGTAKFIVYRFDSTGISSTCIKE